MTDGLIQPEQIAGLDIDCDLLSQSSSEFAMTATAIETASGDVTFSWQRLADVYSAPEAPQLLQAMSPSGVEAATYVTLLRGFGSSIQTLADTVRPHVQRLREVKAEAEEFVSAVSEGVTVWPWDEDHPLRTDGLLSLTNGSFTPGPAVIPWSHHQPSVTQNAALIHRVNTEIAAILDAQATFQGSVRRHISLCYDAPITATVEQLDATRELPWGYPAEKQTTCVEGFGQGFVGALGDTVAGVGTLLVGWMWDPATSGAAWASLGQTLGALGVGLVQTPGYLMVNNEGWEKARQTAPGYIGWLEDTYDWTHPQLQSLADGFVGSEQEWADNPAQASGKLTFNIASIVLPTKGISSALKTAGAGGRVAALVADTGAAVKAVLRSGAETMVGGTARAGSALRELAGSVARSMGDDLRSLNSKVQASVDDLRARLGGPGPAYAGFGDVPTGRPAHDFTPGTAHSVAHVDTPADRMPSGSGALSGDDLTRGGSRLDVEGALNGGPGRLDAGDSWTPMSRAEVDELPIVRDGSHIDPHGNLTPNTWYQAGEHEYIYHTDANGHIDRLIADDLQLKTHDGRLPHDPNTPGKLPGDHAGHLVADGLGGSPFRDNLVSMLSKHNLSEYRKIELQWERALRTDPPGKVSVDIRIVNDATGRPNKFHIRSLVNDEEVNRILRQ